MNTLHHKILGCALTVTFVSGCFTEPRKSDAGHEEFYRQALPKLLGRRATSHNELRFLSALTDSFGESGRRQVVTALMNEEDFVVQWEHVLADQLRVHRDSAASTNLRSCYDDNSVASASTTAALATFVRDAEPTASYGSAFSMTDLIRSSLRLDDVSPIYRAHLFPFVSRPISGANIIEKNKRDDLGSRFLATYLDRDMLCMDCHNSYSSTSGEDSGWDRTYPVPGHFEQALFGSHQGGPLEDVSTVFRSPGGIGSISGSTHPWNLSPSCGSFVARDSVSADTYAYDPAAGPRAAHFGSIQESSAPYYHSVWDLERSLATGIRELKQHGLRRTREEGCTLCGSCLGADPAVPADYAAKREAAALALRTHCESCHDNGPGPTFLYALGNTGTPLPGDWDTPLIRVRSSDASAFIQPQETSASYIYRRVESGEMPPGGLSPSARTTLLNTLAAYINAMPETAGCGMCDSDDCSNGTPSIVQPDPALAYLTAANVVSNTFEELFGYSLTIANHFPRNEEEMGRLWNLTEYGFLQRRGWSLKKVLERLVLSPMFNRMAPAEADGSEPYEIVPVLEPWSVADPRVVSMPTYEEQYNAMTDGIHAHSAYTRLRMVHKALNWPEPKRVAGAGFPSATLQMEIGQFVDDAKPGFTGVDFGGLLAWEDNVGRCNRPSGVTHDWIDTLLETVDLGPPGMLDPAYTYEDVAIAIKDRLLNDASLTGAERTALASLFGVASLSNAADVSNLTTKAREYCGVLLQSPQFLLAGLPPPSAGSDATDPPRLATTSFYDACRQHAPYFRTRGMTLKCFSDSVLVLYYDPTLIDRLGRLCARGACGLLPRDIVKRCTKDNFQECMFSFPMCDPSCMGPTCCGEDVNMLPTTTEEILTTYLEGGVVKLSQGVLVSEINDPKQRPLKEGEELHFGQLLTLPKGSQLIIMLGDEEYQTPKDGVGLRQRREQSKDGKDGPLYDIEEPWTMFVTGQSALKYFPDKPSLEGPVPHELIKVRRRAGPFRMGTAGTPLSTDTPVLVPKKEFPKDYQLGPEDYEVRPLIGAEPKDLGDKKQPIKPIDSKYPIKTIDPKDPVKQPEPTFDKSVLLDKQGLLIEPMPTSKRTALRLP